MNIALPYEVRLKLHGSDGEVSEVVRKEYAYGAIDAAMQASMNQHALTPDKQVSLVSVGPPAEAIIAAASDLTRQINQEIARLVGTSGKKPRT